MPTSTFFRLPEEKRARLVEAGWTEMTQVRFADISVSRIINAAHIPRGSFYQYFEDKEDLVRYLLGDAREYFIAMLRDILKESQGDLFALPLKAYDRFISQQGYTDPILTRLIKLITLNKGYDLQNFVAGPCDLLPEQLWEAVDPSKLRQPDRRYADSIFHLACAVLAFAVVETLHDPDRIGQARALIGARVEVLRYGGAADGYKEEAI